VARLGGGLLRVHRGARGGVWLVVSGRRRRRTVFAPARGTPGPRRAVAGPAAYVGGAPGGRGWSAGPGARLLSRAPPVGTPDDPGQPAQPRPRREGRGGAGHRRAAV